MTTSLNLVGGHSARSRPWPPGKAAAAKIGRPTVLGGPPRQVEQHGEDEIDQDHQEDGDDYGRGGGAAHIFGASAGGEAFLAADRGDDQPENQGFDDAGRDVVGDQGVARGNHITADGEVTADDSEHAAAQDAHEVGPNGEAGQHHRHGQEFRHHQECDRIERHGFQRVQLFGHPHGADLGGKSRAGSSDDHDGRDQRAEFAGDGNGYQAGHQLHGSQALQLVRALQRDDHADEEGDQRNDGQGAHADGHGLVHRALEEAGGLQWREEQQAQRLPEELSQTAYVGDAALAYGAHLRHELHHALPRASSSVWKT